MAFDFEQDRKESIGLNAWIVKTLVLTLPFLLIVYVFCPQAIPYSFLHFWTGYSPQQTWEGILASWPFYLWGIGINCVYLFGQDLRRHKPQDIFVGGFVVSAIAGSFEETIIRWLAFFSAIVGVKISNWFFFGWAASWLELTRLMHWYVVGPFVNLLALGHLKWLLFDQGWAVGAAALIVNAKFRREHAYLGYFGWINSWVAGFLLFYIMFTYGLLSAILVHFLYDFVIYITVAIHAAGQRLFRRPIPRRR